MKRIRVLLLAALLSPGVVAAETVVAVVDPFQAMAEVSEVKSALRELEADMKSKEAEILKLRNEIVAIDEKLKKEDLTLSDQQKKTLTDERDAKLLDYRSRGQLAQKRAEEEQKALLAKMEPKLRSALEAIAKEKGIDVILNRQAALYTKEGVDITRIVTQKINQMK